jgi:transposase
MVDTELSRIYCETRGVEMAEIEEQPQPELQPRRSFTEEFKREAVRLATERGNVSAVARDLGINESVLNRWKRQLQQEGQQPGSGKRPFPGNGNPRDEEMAKLQRELARVKEENAILKKAVGIFTSRPQ